MKLRYECNLTLTGFDEKTIKRKTVFRTHNDLVSHLDATVKYNSHFQKNTAFKKKLEKFIKEVDPKKKSEKLAVATTKKKLVLTVSELKFDDTYDKTNLVWSFHTSLRKACESKSSWGLWQSINFCADNKASDLLDVFWSNAIFTWRQIKSYSKKDLRKLSHEELEKIALTFKKMHLEEMSSDPREMDITKDEYKRRLWYMLIGLYEGIPVKEIASILYDLEECKLK